MREFLPGDFQGGARRHGAVHGALDADLRAVAVAVNASDPLDPNHGDLVASNESAQEQPGIPGGTRSSRRMLLAGRQCQGEGREGKKTRGLSAPVAFLP